VFAEFLVAENQRAHDNYGAPLFASPDDAYAIVGSIVELAARQLRTGQPRTSATSSRSSSASSPASSSRARDRTPGRPRAAGDHLPCLPAAGRVARGGGRDEARRIRRPDLLGPAGSRLRRPERPRPPAGPGAGRARCQPHRPRVHRRSLGDFLYAALHRTGFANQPTSTHRADGLELRDAWVTAAVRCAPPANKPTPEERNRCLPWTAEELELLGEVRVVVCLGAFGWDAALRLLDPAPRPKPKFGHAAEAQAGGRTLLGCFHPSQQNTFTGVLTAEMLDAVLLRARALSGR